MYGMRTLVMVLRHPDILSGDIEFTCKMNIQLYPEYMNKSKKISKGLVKWFLNEIPISVGCANDDGDVWFSVVNNQEEMDELKSNGWKHK